ncbi:MAG: FecR domain-containing protein [Proteobacteria bacterium]|nr:FecR domain-containing protein [Pseudomonadota bacterium]
MIKRIFILLSITLFGSYVQAASQLEQIGEVIFARGVVTAQTGSQIRVLGKAAPIYEGDIITTGPKSFTVIKLNDQTRISLRQNTVFSFEDFAYGQDEEKESAIMRLFKGGLRSISGLISKHNPDGFKVKTSVATIGIRGTKFDARLCQEGECEQEYQKTTDSGTVTPSNVIGRIALLKGKLNSTDKSGELRSLSKGAPLYEGDALETGKDSFAVLAFRDQSRVSLKAETQFKIEKFQYNIKEPDKDSSFFRLVKGGMRALTGLIVKRNPSAYSVATAVATIGIRGTGFDLLWLGPCQGATECGLVINVWEGNIISTNDSGSQDILLGQIARIRAIDLPPDFIDQAPVFIVPRPDKVDIDFDNLFSTTSITGIEPGLYVACYEGHCTMQQEDRSLDLGAGEAGFASIDGQQLIRLERIEPFQTDDPYLRTINQLFDTLYELLDDTIIAENEFECIVQ